MIAALSGEQRAQALADLAGWTDMEGRNAIHKSFQFKEWIITRNGSMFIIGSRSPFPPMMLMGCPNAILPWPEKWMNGRADSGSIP